MKISQRGMTLVEMVIVFALIGIVAAISLPKLASSWNVLAVRSATQEIGAYISQARAVAIETGRVGHFIRKGNVIELAVENTSGTIEIVGSEDLGAGNGVTLSASPSDTITFDPRGMRVSGGSSSSPKVVVTRNVVTDSVCVVGLGKVSVSRCQLAQ